MRLSDFTIGAPIERLGTKCPSITSTCIRSALARSASAACSPRRAKSAARIDGASFAASLSMSRLSLSLSAFVRGNDFLAGFEDFNEPLISPGNLRYGGVPRYLLCTPVNQRIPEAGSANGKPNEARNRSSGREAFADLSVVFAPSENDAADSVPASPAGSSNNPFAVLLPLEAFDLPYVRLDPRVLKVHNGLRHQRGTKFPVISLLVSS